MDSDNVITNLKIIKMINVNEKLSIRKGHLQIDYHPFQFIKRWFYNDSRDLVVLFIKDLINNVSHHKDNEMVIHEINGIYKGLQNLKITYSADPIICVNIDNFIKKFEFILKNNI